MTDNEIIKAMECCCAGDCSCCETCPALAECDTPILGMKYLITNALDIINRQKAEIERLRKETERFADIGKMYSEIKAEAVKEFAERLKKEKFTEYFCGQKYDLIHGWINNLVKEMVGDNYG